MPTETLLDEYRKRLDVRRQSGTLSPTTSETYLNDATRIIEVLLQSIPAAAVQGYMEAAGYQGDYRHVIEALQDLCREPGHMAFPDRPERIHKARKVKDQMQKPLL